MDFVNRLKYMNKTIIFLLLLYSHIHAADKFSFNSIREDVLKNKSNFEGVLGIIRVHPGATDLIISVLNGDEPQDKLRFFEQYITFYRLLKGCGSCFEKTLYDSMFVMPIARMLCADPQNYKGLSQYALETLVDYPQISYLFSLSDSIKPYVKCITGYSIRKNYLLSFLNLDKSEKAKLLKAAENDRNFPIAVRARLGDKDAEQKLIEKYNEEQYYHNKKILVKELFRAGTDACLKNLIIRFNEPMYDIVQNNCVKESIRYPIIQGFRRMHPEDSLFKEPFRCVDTLRFPKPDMVNSFLEQFKEWAYKKYKVKPEGSEPEPVLLKNFCVIR